MLKDLSALTPPLLMAAAFIIAAAAFVRHEMRGGRNRPEVDRETDSGPDSSSDAEVNAGRPQQVSPPANVKPDDGSQD